MSIADENYQPPDWGVTNGGTDWDHEEMLDEDELENEEGEGEE
jgi:hypothetical protein